MQKYRVKKTTRYVTFGKFKAADLLFKVGVRYGGSPLQVSGDAARFESVPQPGASDLFGICRPVSCAGGGLQPLLQLSLQLQEVKQENENSPGRLYRTSSQTVNGCNNVILRVNLLQLHPLHEVQIRLRTFGRSRKRCLEERMTGVCLQTLHWGSWGEDDSDLSGEDAFVFLFIYFFYFWRNVC